MQATSPAATELSPLRKRLCVGLLVLLAFSLGCTEFAPIGIEPELADGFGVSLALLAFGRVLFISNLLSGVLDNACGLRSNIVLLLVQAAILLGLWRAGSAMPAALAIIMLLGLVMYAASVSCITLFMRMASERHPKALTLASSLEPMAFNIGIAFGTAIGGEVATRAGLGALGLVGAGLALVACGCAVLAAHLEP